MRSCCMNKVRCRFFLKHLDSMVKIRNTYPISFLDMNPGMQKALECKNLQGSRRRIREDISPTHLKSWNAGIKKTILFCYFIQYIGLQKVVDSITQMVQTPLTQSIKKSNYSTIIIKVLKRLKPANRTKPTRKYICFLYVNNISLRIPAAEHQSPCRFILINPFIMNSYYTDL